MATKHSKTTRGVSFDEFYNIRVLDPAEFKQAEKLNEECGQFLGQVTQFNELVHGITQVFNGNARQIEEEKLQAMGLRNRIAMQRDQKERRRRALQVELDERNRELERLAAEYESLVKVEAEQRIRIEKLGSDGL